MDASHRFRQEERRNRWWLSPTPSLTPPRSLSFDLGFPTSSFSFLSLRSRFPRSPHSAMDTFVWRSDSQGEGNEHSLVSLHSFFFKCFCFMIWKSLRIPLFLVLIILRFVDWAAVWGESTFRFFVSPILSLLLSSSYCYLLRSFSAGELGFRWFDLCYLFCVDCSHQFEDFGCAFVRLFGYIDESNDNIHTELRSRLFVVFHSYWIWWSDDSDFL